MSHLNSPTPTSRALSPSTSHPGASPSAAGPSNQKSDQIVHRLFVKLVNVVADARISSQQQQSQNSSPYDTDDTSSRTTGRLGARDASGRHRRESRTDKWFNLETLDFDQFRGELGAFRSLSSIASASIPTLHVNVLLSVPPSPNPQAGGGAHHGMNPAKVLVHHFPAPDTTSPSTEANARITRITPAPRYILLETHTLSFVGTSGMVPSDSASIELPQVYKQAISLFRSVYTLLRILPAWKLQRRLRRQRGSSSSAMNLGIEIQLSVGQPLDFDLDEGDAVAGFDGPHSQPASSLTSEAITFPPITTPIGSFSLRSIYRAHAHYALESLESLLSHHFLLSPSSATSELPNEANSGRTSANRRAREPVQFTPTIASALERQRRESLQSAASASSPRSPLPSLPSVSPLPLPVPDRARPFPLQGEYEGTSGSHHSPHVVGSAPISMPMRKQISNVANISSPSSSVSSSSRPRRISALGSVSSQSTDFPSGAAAMLGGGAGGGVSASNSSPRFGFLHGRDPADLPFAVGLGSGRTSGVMERTRKESLLGNSGVGERSTATPNHGRRPSINTIHPFKSATVSSSPSSASFRAPGLLQQASSSSPFIPSSSANPSTTSFPTITERGSSSDRATSHASTAAVPTHAPGSPDRPSLQLSTTRYTSSFDTRPTLLAPSSAAARPDRTPISSLNRASPLRPHLRTTSAESLSAITADDDDISAFVKAIDARAPLRGGDESASASSNAFDFPLYDASPTPAHLPLPSSGPSSPLSGAVSPTSSIPPSASIIRSRADVDETLRRMTESFRAGFGSLQGGLRSRRSRTESAGPSLGGGTRHRLASDARPSPLLEEEVFLGSGSGNASPSGQALAHGLGTNNNLSTSSLFAGGRRSYDSAEQIVGRMDMTDEGLGDRAIDSTRRGPSASISSRPSGITSTRHPNTPDPYGDLPFAPRRY